MKKMMQSIQQSKGAEDAKDEGFTLVEILIAIVLVGVLSAVVIVGISNLTSKGSTSACAASADAAKAGTIVYYASNANSFPTAFDQLTTATAGPPAVPAALTLPSGATVDATKLIVSMGTSWKLTMTPGVGGAAPTFVCS